MRATRSHGEFSREAGVRLGRHIAALVNVFDPEMIVFGGEGLRFAGHLFDPLRKVLDEVCYPGAPPIAFDWERNSWQRGAAALGDPALLQLRGYGRIQRQRTASQKSHDRVE